MTIFVFPGASHRNSIWQDLAEKHKDVVCIAYEHWQTDQKMNLEREQEIVDKLNIAEDDLVIAKSIGTFLALRSPHIPKKMVFCGLPLHFCKKHEIAYQELLEKKASDITVYQNTDDPQASFTQVKQIIQKAYELPGDTHFYDPDIIFEKAMLLYQNIQ